MKHSILLIFFLLSFASFTSQVFSEEKPILERDGLYPLNSAYYDKISIYSDGTVVYSERGYEPIWQSSTIAQLPASAIDNIKNILALMVAGNLWPESNYCSEYLTNASYNAVNAQNESFTFAAGQFCIENNSEWGAIIGQLGMRYLFGFDTAYNLVSMLDGFLGLAYALRDNILSAGKN